MMMAWDGYEYQRPDYKSYRAVKFEKNRNKTKNLLSSIKDSSLKKEDKIKLLAEIKKIVNEFEITH